MTNAVLGPFEQSSIEYGYPTHRHIPEDLLSQLCYGMLWQYKYDDAVIFSLYSILRLLADLMQNSLI